MDLSKHETLSQSCFNVGPPSTTLSQHKTTSGQYLLLIEILVRRTGNPSGNLMESVPGSSPITVPCGCSAQDGSDPHIYLISNTRHSIWGSHFKGRTIRYRGGGGGEYVSLWRWTSDKLFLCFVEEQKYQILSYAFTILYVNICWHDILVVFFINFVSKLLFCPHFQQTFLSTNFFIFLLDPSAPPRYLTVCP